MARERTVTQFLKQEKLQEFTDSEEGHTVISAFTNHGLRPGSSTDPLTYCSLPCCLDGVLLLRFIEGHAGAIVAKDLCAQLFKSYLENCNAPYNSSSRMPGSHSTKSTSPGIEESFGQHHYNPEKVGLIDQPDSQLAPPSYHGLPKPKHV